MIYLTDYQAKLIKILSENEVYIPTDKYILRGLNQLLETGLIYQPEPCAWSLTELGRVWAQDPHVSDWRRKKQPISADVKVGPEIYAFRDALREVLGLPPIND